jgi:transcriptional regulator with XRE-family HTH domain
MRTVQEQFGARVRDLRKKRGWTQEQLAEAAGRHWTYIGGIERGERNITLEVVADIARALDVEIEELFRELSGKGTKR